MYRTGHHIYNQPGKPWAFLGGLEWTIKFLGPVRPGDRLRNRITIADKRVSAKGGRGVVQDFNDLLNQSEQLVLRNLVSILMPTRPEGHSAGAVVSAPLPG